MTAPYTAAELVELRARFDWPCTISRLVAELIRAREALRPFAKEADSYDPDDGDGPYRAWASNFTVEQLRAARAALGEEPADGDTER